MTVEKGKMTVETFVNALDRNIAFKVSLAHDKEILFNSTGFNTDKWKDVKDKTVFSFYPANLETIYIYVYPDWMMDDGETETKTDNADDK